MFGFQNSNVDAPMYSPWLQKLYKLIFFVFQELVVILTLTISAMTKRVRKKLMNQNQRNVKVIIKMNQRKRNLKVAMKTDKEKGWHIWKLPGKDFRSVLQKHFCTNVSNVMMKKRSSEVINCFVTWRFAIASIGKLRTTFTFVQSVLFMALTFWKLRSIFTQAIGKMSLALFAMTYFQKVKSRIFVCTWLNVTQMA